MGRALHHRLPEPAFTYSPPPARIRDSLLCGSVLTANADEKRFALAMRDL